MTITIWPPQTAPENEDILTTDFQTAIKEILMANHVSTTEYSTSFTPTAGSGLTLNVAAGVAWIAGKRVEIDVISQLTMTASATNYVFLNEDGTFHVDTGNTPPTNYVNIATVLCGATTITTVTDARLTNMRAVDSLYFDYVNRDIRLSRAAANILILAAGDALGLDTLYFDSANRDIALTRAAASILKLATGDAFALDTLYLDATNRDCSLTRVSAAVIQVLGSLLPDGDGTRSIGSTAKRLLQLHSKKVQIFSTSALTAGSLGSLMIPINAAGSTISDAQGGNLDGCLACAWTGTTYKLAVRLNGAWKYVTPAGFGIPNYSVQKNAKDEWVHADGEDETICPLCKMQMKPKQALGMYADEWWGKDKNDGLHAVACHLKCLIKLAEKEEE